MRDVKSYFRLYLITGNDKYAYVMKHKDYSEEFIYLKEIYDFLKNNFDQFLPSIKETDTMFLLQQTAKYMVETSLFELPVYYGHLSLARDHIINENLKSDKRKSENTILQDSEYVETLFNAAVDFQAFITDVIDAYCYESNIFIKNNDVSFSLISKETKKDSINYSKIDLKLRKAHELSELYAKSKLEDIIPDTNVKDFAFNTSKRFLYLQYYNKIELNSWFALNKTTESKNKINIDLILKILCVIATYSYLNFDLELQNNNFDCKATQSNLRRTIRGLKYFPYAMMSYNNLTAFLKSRITDINDNELKTAIDLLTIDISNLINDKIILNNYLFFQTGNNYHWLGTGLSTLAFDTVIYNRLSLFHGKKEKNDQTYQKKISDIVEENIAKAFIRSGFNAINSASYKCDQYEGEIDILVYCETSKILFIIEHKNTAFARSSIHEINKFKDTLLGAVDQLDKSKKFIEEYFEKNEFREFKESLKIKSDFHEIKLFPLITANTFEYDRFSQLKYPKISLFELGLIFESKSEPVVSNGEFLQKAIEDDTIWNDSFKGVDFSKKTVVEKFAKYNITFEYLNVEN